MFDSETTEITKSDALLKNNVLDYISDYICGLGCGITVKSKNYTQTVSGSSYIYLKHNNAVALFCFSCYTLTNGFSLQHYYANNDSAISGPGNNNAAIPGDYTRPESKITLTISYNIYDTNNFVFTISCNNLNMLFHQHLSFGVLETLNGLCYVNLYYPEFGYDKNVPADFTKFTGLLNNVNPPGGKVFTAPVYYQINNTNLTATEFTHCIQARISGITQGGLYKIGGKEYICINASSGLLMEVKR